MLTTLENLNHKNFSVIQKHFRKLYFVAVFVESSKGIDTVL